MVLALSGGRQPSCVVEQVPKSPQLGQQSGLSLPLVEPDVAWRNCTLADRHCRFNETIDQLKVIKYRGGKEGAAYLAGEFNRIFREAGVPEHIRHEISKEMLAGKTVHTTYGSEDRREAERTLMGNITLLTEVVRLYYYDFVLFDYELPSMF
ncbi:hypothetical protein Q1695_007183 [Nippostrongylus brasiliensis]|nr:hypothetical protein Q1695_007183 [Nippostrongylus brasiliensis]